MAGGFWENFEGLLLTPGGVVSLTFHELSKIISRKIYNDRNHIYGESFRLKVSAWNSHKKYEFSTIHTYPENILESSRNVNETSRWLTNTVASYANKRKWALRYLAGSRDRCLPRFLIAARFIKKMKSRHFRCCFYQQRYRSQMEGHVFTHFSLQVIDIESGKFWSRHQVRRKIQYVCHDQHKQIFWEHKCSR